MVINQGAHTCAPFDVQGSWLGVWSDWAIMG